ncbi:MAG TPA: PIG-L family deacetylase [Candidatus Dormibacteraeota bacterium]|nr:PIG-L family deacetylase [Candidatus Dormibacteraeota bacterium]
MSRRRKFSVIPATVSLGVLFFLPGAVAQFPPAPGTGSGLAETIEAIDAARVTTRILYITAHPDDESAATLTYLARGLHADVVLLSLTHGEGGQNALGPEQAPQLGLIRTQELLAATRGYGVKLYFTRAKDFGFSKTPEETEKIWGDQVLEDMVRVIRALRPNIVINHFGGVHSGHGHHQVSGLWTTKAVRLAADKSFQVYPGCVNCPEDYTWGSPTNEVTILDLDRGSESPSGYVLPLDDVAPLWGKSWRQLGLDAFVNHRTQGISAFVDSSFLRRSVGLKREDGKPFDPSILAQPLSGLAKFMQDRGCAVPEGTAAQVANAEKQVKLARENALTLRWPEAAAAIAEAALTLQTVADKNREMKECLGNSDFVQYSEFLDTKERAERALRLAGGVSINATADQGELAAGEPFHVTVSARCRQEVKCELSEPEVDFATGTKQLERKKLPTGTFFTIQATGESVMREGRDIGFPNGLPFARVMQRVRISGYALDVEEKIQHVEATSTSLNRVPLRLVEPFNLYIEPKQRIIALPRSPEPFDVFLRIRSNKSEPQTLKVVTADVPLGWTVNNEEVKFEGKGDKYVRLRITPTKTVEPGEYAIKPYVKREPPVLKIRPSDSYYKSLEPLPSLPTQMWEEPAQTVVHAFDINVPENLHVGYVTAENEPVPEALRNLGVKVEMLDAAALNFSDLSRFDAIVVGVRAYELRNDLAAANQRLLDYVRNGGRLLVQYQRDFAWDKAQYAPYPAKIDSGKPGAPLPRITDEAAAVKFLKPDDPLLNTPNKITQNDFSGWVQERGLYFWTDFDSKYTTLLAMHDPGEPDLNGGLVYTRLGKGIYIYTGLAFFRQLPEGVPGAYRLFVNLLAPHRVQ